MTVILTTLDGKRYYAEEALMPVLVRLGSRNCIPVRDHEGELLVNWAAVVTVREVKPATEEKAA